MNKLEKLIKEHLEKYKAHPDLEKHYPFAEWVSIDFLDSIREYDRDAQFNSWEYESIDKLVEDIRINGIKEPVRIKYSIPDESVLLEEGNHRLVASKKLGWNKLPAIVTRTHYKMSDEQLKKSKKVAPYNREKWGNHIPAEFRPSKLGI